MLLVCAAAQYAQLQLDLARFEVETRLQVGAFGVKSDGRVLCQVSSCLLCMQQILVYAGRHLVLVLQRLPISACLCLGLLECATGCFVLRCGLGLM
jgi:hypothetical protein